MSICQKFNRRRRRAKDIHQQRHVIIEIGKQAYEQTKNIHFEVNLFAENFFKSGYGAFQETLFLSEAEKINVELYVEKNRYALEKLVRQMKNFRENGKVWRSLACFKEQNSKYQLNLSPKRQREDNFQRNSQTKVSFQSQFPLKSANKINPDPETKISNRSDSKGLVIQKINLEEFVSKSSKEHSKQKVNKTQKAKESKDQEKVQQALPITIKTRKDSFKLSNSRLYSIIAHSYPTSDKNVRSWPTIIALQNGISSIDCKDISIKKYCSLNSSKYLKCNKEYKLRHWLNQTNNNCQKISLFQGNIFQKLKVFLAIVLMLFLLASNHFEEKEEKQPFDLHSQEKPYYFILINKQNLKAKKPKKLKRK